MISAINEADVTYVIWFVDVDEETPPAHFEYSHYSGVMKNLVKIKTWSHFRTFYVEKCLNEVYL